MLEIDAEEFEFGDVDADFKAYEEFSGVLRRSLGGKKVVWAN